MNFECLLILSVLTVFDIGVYGKAQLSLKITKYHTYSHRRLDGRCCGDFSNLQPRKCAIPCMQRFRICLEYYQAKVSLTDPNRYSGPCAFGDKDTDPWGPSNMKFSKTHIYAYNFDISHPWPIYINVIIEAYEVLGGGQNNRGVIDRISYKNTLKPSMNKNEWHDITLPNGPSVYEFSIRLTCNKDYYGVSCDKYCRNRLGHYKCDDSGYKICDHGWMGPDCNTTICQPGCHSVHGFCKKPGECKCTEGWKGPYCDECIKYPGCVHGTCIDSPWTCYCQPNWGGNFCDESLNYCAENSPCKNGGICENQPSKESPYKCICPSGFHGQNCEIDPCLPNPCKKGTCIKSNDEFYCQCFDDWTGRYCDLDSSICDPFSCKNGGKCQKDEQGLLRCVCQPGFRGSECHLSAPCENSQCKHAIHCQTRSIINDEYECICKDGWTGKYCDQKINRCKNNPCKNRGICKDADNEYSCQCEDGFRGRNCEINAACESKPCKNGGVCQESDSGFLCKCKKDYSGKRCEVYKTGCSPNPCRNGAYCYTFEQDIYCQCSQDYWGKYCEHHRPYCGKEPCALAYDACSMPFLNLSDISRHICGKYGTCVSKINRQFECKCMPGFLGAFCEKNIDDCQHNVCENGGICVDGINDYECICENGFQGKNCEQRIDYCKMNPCINGGDCKEKSTQLYNDFVCQCPPSWGGRLCHLLGDKVCDEKTCLHGGLCSVDQYEPNRFKCDCKNGWVGSVCQFRDDLSKPCSKNNACRNGGICIPFGDTDYSCHCPDGFDGKHCEKSINECHPNPCFNGGKCQDLINSFKCECPKGFYGSNCQSNFDDCIAHPCAYGSVCIDRIDGFECRCPEDRTGLRCDQPINNKPPEPPSCIYYNRTFDSGQHWSYNCQNCRCDTGKISCKRANCGVWSCLKANGSDDPFACKEGEVCHAFHFDQSRCFVAPCVTKAKCLKSNAEIPSMHVSWPGETSQHCRPNGNHKNNYCAQILLKFEKANMPLGVTIDDICDALKVLSVVRDYKNTVQGNSLAISCDVNDIVPTIINVAIYSLSDNMLMLKSTNTLRPFVHFLSDKMADNIIDVVRKNYSILSGLVDIKVETLLLQSDMSDQSSLIKYMLIPLIFLGILIFLLIFWHHRCQMREIRKKYSTKPKFNNSKFQTASQYPNMRSSGQQAGLVPVQTQYMAYSGDNIQKQNIPSMWPNDCRPFNS